ncbi:LysR family transcriptional regulator [Minwuia sp.]|uniref:LysR family transcriptional regulator n=1 Tax=Minwuia sp. TaxID=2493630 RepID=UPI003A950E06
MRFTLDQMRAFLTVANTGGVRRASEVLHLTQPAITSRIKNLEAALGAELFDRKAGMALTKSGAGLVKYAEQYLKLSDLILRDVAVADGVEMVLRIGVSETIVQSWLPEFITRLRQAFPHLEIEIGVDISVNLRESLLNNAIDFAILMGPVSDYRVDNVILPDFRLAWYCAADQILPDDPVEVFRTTPVITFAKNTRPHRLIRTELLERYGAGIVMFPSSSLSACFRLIASGLGLGALPTALAQHYLQSGEIRPYDPGWQPAALGFSASFLCEPEGAIGARAAQIARDVAVAYDRNR